MLGTAFGGLRVLDFSQIGAGPLCGMLMGDMGADVIKVEALSGDLGRRLGPPWLNGESVIAMSFNRNKRGLAIDLKKPEALAAVRGMAARADVLIESFRPGARALAAARSQKTAQGDQPQHGDEPCESRHEDQCRLRKRWL